MRIKYISQENVQRFFFYFKQIDLGLRAILYKYSHFIVKC